MLIAVARRLVANVQQYRMRLILPLHSALCEIPSDSGLQSCGSRAPTAFRRNMANANSKTICDCAELDSLINRSGSSGRVYYVRTKGLRTPGGQLPLRLLVVP